MMENEIVQALKACARHDNCPENCPGMLVPGCESALKWDAASLIECQRREIERLHKKIADIEQVKKAALQDLANSGPCFACKHFKRNGGKCWGGNECRRRACMGLPIKRWWKWRGICEIGRRNENE